MKTNLLRIVLIVSILFISARFIEARSVQDNADGLKAKTYKLAQDNQKMVMQIAADQVEIRRIVEENNVLLKKLDARFVRK